MGYSSDVTILIYGPEDEMAGLIAAERMRKKDSPLTLHEGAIKTQEATTRSGEKLTILKAEFLSVKWYDGNPKIQAWHDLLLDLGDRLDAAENPEAGIQYEFIRIGEDQDDIDLEYSECAEYWAQVSRTVEVNIPSPTTQPEKEIS